MNIDQNLISSLDKASPEDKAEILALIEELEELKQVEAAGRIGADAVELHTGPYALATRQTLTTELARLSEAGEATSALGMRLHAGHGLNYNNVRPVAAIPNMIELNIGHSVVSRAVMVGMRDAVAEMRRILDVCQP